MGYCKDHYGADVVYFKTTKSVATMHRWQLKLGTGLRSLEKCKEMIDDIVNGLGKTLLAKIAKHTAKVKRELETPEANLKGKRKGKMHACAMGGSYSPP
jgi:hypothetical protein